MTEHEQFLKSKVGIAENKIFLSCFNDYEYILNFYLGTALLPLTYEKKYPLGIVLFSGW